MSEKNTKLTVNPSPSAELIAKAQAEFTFNDGKGRSITLKKPGILSQFRIVEVVGELAKNEVYMAMVMPLIYVSAIDGDAVSFPSTKRELEALIQRLDEEGVEAVSIEASKHFGKSKVKEDQAAIKN